MIGSASASSLSGLNLAVGGLRKPFISNIRSVDHRNPFQNVQKNAADSMAAKDKLSSLQISSPAGNVLYQPFRPPPSVDTSDSAENLDLEEHLRILRDRIGFWHEYAQLIPGLSRFGFTPASIEEATGIPGVEQNKIVVASKVRSSLISSGFDENSLAHFDKGGAHILYEFRTLSVEQRKLAAEYAVEKNIEPKEARELARAMKDFERRRKEGWDSFSALPGDCLAYYYFCLSKEYKTETQKRSALEKAFSLAVTDKSRAKILEFLETDDKEEQKEAAEVFRSLPVVRLLEGEVESAKTPLVLPVINPNLTEIVNSPSSRPVGGGPFRVYRSDCAWKDWVVLPAWQPLAEAEAPVLVCFEDAGVLPWKHGHAKRNNETILVAVDKSSTDVHPSCFSLVTSADKDLLVLKRGSEIAQGSETVLGMAVLVVRPPKPEEDGPESIEWD